MGTGSNKLSILTLSMFTDPERPNTTFPKLSGLIKAAECRHLLRPLYKVFCRFVRAEHPAEPAMQMSLHALIIYQDCLNSRDHVLPQAEAARLNEAVQDSLLFYNLCTDWAKA